MKTIKVKSQLMLVVPLIAAVWSLPIFAQSTPASTAAPAVRPSTPPATPPATAPGASIDSTATPSAAAAAATAAAQPLTPPADYVIGPDDLLDIVFWREKDLSLEVMVRPDGRISLPLLNDVQAAGLTPDQLRQKLMTEGQRFVEDPNATVVVKQINSRRLFVTGQVAKPGVYPLTGPTTVLQAISMVGGVLEYADSKNIIIMRTENGRPVNYRFNYKDVIRQKNLKQNILLKPGDTIVVP